jgi:hypothetical protein
MKLTRIGQLRPSIDGVGQYVIGNVNVTPGWGLWWVHTKLSMVNRVGLTLGAEISRRGMFPWRT